MRLKFIAIIFALPLAACDDKAIDRAEIALLGHSTVAAALDEPPLIIDTPSSSSVEYVAPPTEPCQAGEFAFRIWSCGPDNHRQYI